MSARFACRMASIPFSNAGWGGSSVEPLAGDASFRRYFRLRNEGRTAMLMHAPPPHEDPGPFLHVGQWLLDHGLRAPAIHADGADRGLVLIEDFGNDRMRDWLDENPSAEDATYRKAIDALVALHDCPRSLCALRHAAYMREVRLFTEWFCPAAGLAVMWRRTMQHGSRCSLRCRAAIAGRHGAARLPCRKHHAAGDGEQGLIDFQDALVGHPAYDLVSLLQDARRDVSPELEQAMLDHYRRTGGCGPHFLADYALLGAQRNAKIVGIFTRLWQRDGKPRYLSLIPRVWGAMERDLAHPALAPVANGSMPMSRRMARAARRRPGMSRLASDTAMVMAAGLGKRMRPLTATQPKPMVRVAGKPLIDHALDRLAEAGIAKAVVNVHYLADALEAHLAARKAPASPSRTSASCCSKPAAGWSRRPPAARSVLLPQQRQPLARRPANAFADLSSGGIRRMDALLLLVPHKGAPISSARAISTWTRTDA
jgi:N-acetylmuramate 1-kinase